MASLICLFSVCHLGQITRINFLNLPLVKQIYCRKQKLEKPQMDAKCKRLSNLIKENAKRRMELLEKESSLV